MTRFYDGNNQTAPLGPYCLQEHKLAEETADDKSHDCRKETGLDVFQSPKIVFILANSADPNLMLHYYATFHRGLHFLPK